ncbi:MAG: R-SNARE protein, VAMP72-family [Monoraphidium minutum]|nr:MAG: R-SNARE protein, VAMP72-family [Monoraphidium minutum]
MPLVFSSIARADGTVLCEYASINGNFSKVVADCMQHVTATPDPRMTITCDRHNFNFLKQNGWTYLAVADEAFGRQVPFAYLERVAREWEAGPAAKAQRAGPRTYDRGFGPKLRVNMESLNASPEQVDRVAAVQKQVDDVKSVMVENIEQVLARGDRIQLLVDRTEDLQVQAAQFQKQGRQLRTNMWWQNAKMKLCFALIILIVLVVIVLLACFTGGGNRCAPKKPPPQEGSPFVPQEGQP